MPFSVHGQVVVVVGAGRSGRAAAALLVSRGAQVTLADTNVEAFDGAHELAASGVNFARGAHPPSLFSGADLIVLSPGVPLDEPSVAAARRAGVPIVGEIELASRWLSGRMIAITGTKGKSTTTTLTARMLHEGGFTVTAGGNLGTALSSQVDESTAHALHVVEVSSFQLEATDRFHPWIAVFLNLSPDHLDRHTSFEEYAAAKARIFDNQTAEDWAVINADDPGVLDLARGIRARRIEFALDQAVTAGVTVENGQVVRRHAGVVTPLLPLTSVLLPGRHLLADVLAAVAVGSVAGVAPAAMRRAVEGFTGLEHALERVASIGGVTFVNDSKATNVVSAKRAIESFERGVVPIMGGRYKGGDFGELRDVLRDRARAVVAIGEAAGRIRAAFEDVLPVETADTLPAAVRLAFEMSQPDGVVLLAPGCASFDMFRDYIERGRAFKDAVAALAIEERGTDK
jgi:UDP-N-acetylmuramoylalanine--D-glutamate ligase